VVSAYTNHIHAIEILLLLKLSYTYLTEFLCIYLLKTSTYVTRIMYVATLIYRDDSESSDVIKLKDMKLVMRNMIMRNEYVTF